MENTNFSNVFREVQWFFNIFDQKTLKRYYNKRKCTSTPVQIGPNLSNSEFALRDHKVLPDVTKQPLLLREFFSHQILEKMLTCLTKSFITFSSNCAHLPPKILYPHSSRPPTGGIPMEVFPRGYFDRGYSDMGYSDTVYLLRVFPQVVPSAHTSPLLLKGGINLGLPNTTRMRANTPWARKRYHKRKAICGLQALLY